MAVNKRVLGDKSDSWKKAASTHKVRSALIGLKIKFHFNETRNGINLEQERQSVRYPLLFVCKLFMVYISFPMKQCGGGLQGSADAHTSASIHALCTPECKYRRA